MPASPQGISAAMEPMHDFETLETGPAATEFHRPPLWSGDMATASSSRQPCSPGSAGSRDEAAIFVEFVESLDKRLQALEAAIAKEQWKHGLQDALQHLEQRLEHRLLALEENIPVEECVQKIESPKLVPLCQIESNIESQALSASVGDRVEGLYHDGHWKGATIDAVLAPDKYKLAWDDGDTELVIRSSTQIRRKEGEEIEMESSTVWTPTGAVDKVLQADDTRAHSHTLNPSIFEATLFIGLRSMGCWNSVVIASALVFEVAISFFILYLVADNFLNRKFPTIDAVLEWRAREGHLLHNMGSSSATSLVSRLCNKDPALVTAPDMQDMLSTLETYGRAGSGIALATICLLLWFLTVSQAVLQAFSLIVAVWNRPGGETNIICEDGCLKMGPVSGTRKLGVTIVTLTRVAADVVLLIIGGIWICLETHITDLVLNAAALAFILDLDSLVFHAFMTSHVKTLIADLEPLPTPHSKKHGWMGRRSAFVIPAVTFLLGIAYVGLMTVAYSLPLQREMRQVIDAFCGEPLDFVYFKHETGILWAAPTDSFVVEAAHLDVLPILQVMRTGDLEHSSLLLKDLDVGHLRHTQFKTIASVAQDITNLDGLAGNRCEDYDFKASSANPLLVSTVQRAIGEVRAVDCAELRPHCDGHLHIVRILCPATCGCDDPLAGLYWSGHETGCPAEYCGPKKEEVLSTRVCEDHSPGELQDSAAWRRFWRSMLGSPTTPEGVREVMSREVFADGVGGLMQGGCAVIPGLSEKATRFLCEGNDESGSIAAFCPVACHCTAQWSSNCPRSCHQALDMSLNGSNHT